MALHRTLVWYLRGEQVRRDMDYSIHIPSRSFQQQWTAGPNATVAVSMVRVAVTALIEDIELWLRGQLQKELQRTHGVRWWAALPPSLQQRAAFRYKLACADFGRRRAGSPHSTNLFSFGDILKALDVLDTLSWQRCLDATKVKQRSVFRAFKAIKAFRDNRIAHQQSGGPTHTEITRLVHQVQSLAALIRPADYLLIKEKLAILKRLRQHQRSQLFQLYDRPKPPFTRRGSRLRALRQLLSAIDPDCNNTEEVEYFDELLRCCAVAGGTISPFIGDD